MADFDYLFIHPLIGTDKAWSGFLIESVTGKATQESLQNFFAHEELAQFDKRHPWFFPAPQTTDFVASTLEQGIATFPADNPAAEDGELLRSVEATLRQGRKKVALKTSPSKKLPGTGAWDYVLLGINQARCQPPFSLLGLASRTGIIATDVHSHADHDWASANACALSTTEFLLNRHASGKTADLTRLKLLELLSLIVADADTAEIEDIFRQEPKLAYSLLRLVNSAANSPRSPITCFSQAINLLGRRQLQRWLQLLVFADANNGQQANPLLQKAATRGRQMELLAAMLGSSDNPEHFLDAAFMAGTFSLLDALLNMPIKEVLEHLPLPAIVQQAIAEHSGPLGLLLEAISASEKRDLTKAQQLLSALSIAPERYLDSQLTALAWAAKTHPAA